MTNAFELRFPGGSVIKARPSRAQLLDSGNAWLALAQTQVGSVRYWAEQGDRTEEARKALDVLASHVDHARRAFAEAEKAR